MTFQEANNPAFEGVELAGAFGSLAWLIAGLLGPLGDGFRVQLQFHRDLGGGEMLFIQEQADLAECGVIDHG